MKNTYVTISTFIAGLLLLVSLTGVAQGPTAVTPGEQEGTLIFIEETPMEEEPGTMTPDEQEGTVAIPAKETPMEEIGIAEEEMQKTFIELLEKFKQRMKEQEEQPASFEELNIKETTQTPEGTIAIPEEATMESETVTTREPEEAEVEPGRISFVPTAGEMLTTTGAQVGEALAAVGAKAGVQARKAAKAMTTKAYEALSQYLTKEEVEEAAAEIKSPKTNGQQLSEHLKGLFATELLIQLDNLKNKEQAQQETAPTWWALGRRFITSSKTIKKDELADAFTSIGIRLNQKFSTPPTYRSPIMEVFRSPYFENGLKKIGENLQRLAQRKRAELTDNNLWIVLHSFITEAQEIIDKEVEVQYEEQRTFAL